MKKIAAEPYRDIYFSAAKRSALVPLEAGARVGTVLTATLFDMALGGWLSGVIFDLTGS